MLKVERCSSQNKVTVWGTQNNWVSVQFRETIHWSNVSIIIYTFSSVVTAQQLGEIQTIYQEKFLYHEVDQTLEQASLWSASHAVSIQEAFG